MCISRLQTGPRRISRSCLPHGRRRGFARRPLSTPVTVRDRRGTCQHRHPPALPRRTADVARRTHGLAELVEQLLDRGGDKSNASCSGAVNVISKTFSIPPRPRTTGTPKNSAVPNSPWSRTAHGRTVPIAQDRVDHLEARRRRRVERRAGLEQCDDLRATVRGPLFQRLHPLGREELGDRHAGDGRVARERNHRVAMTAEDERVGVLDADAELLGDEGPEPGSVEDAGHPEDALAREARTPSGATWHIASSGFVTMIRIASG